MNRAFFLSVLLTTFAAFAGIATADVRYEKINLADFCNNPEVFDGRSVEVSARVIAINAESKSMELFDSASSTMITVKLRQLRKSERAALINNDVRRVEVSGRARMVEGRLVIDAEKIQILPLETAVKDQTVPVAVIN
jgi:hypothetical protein